MKIYLDNNLGVANVEQEELTQDTIGYNILKVYIPNAVLTPYDTFTCYYGALLQNGRKVGWFAMEARTSSDADYEANYTLYKATLEQCVVSVEGKVYIGCQVLLGNSGNATLIKKNTAVVQFNVRKSVAINNDILVLDTDQTTTDVLESYKNLLENALLTYATKAEVYTKVQVDALLLQKADKATTYNKDEVNSALALKADKSDTYTKTEVNNIANGLSARITANADDIDTLEGNVTTLETDIADLKSVQNVVEVVATKSALNSYDTSKLDVNDKVQVIADESHDSASTIYNWSGSAWQYVGAFGGNSYTKAETYNKTQIDSALSDKADKSDTYTRAVIDSMVLTLSTDKADKSNTYTKTEIDNTMQEVGEMFEIVGNEVLKKADKTELNNAINDLRWELGSHTLDVTTDTDTKYLKSVPSGAIGCQINTLGGMSYKSENLLNIADVAQTVKNGITYSVVNGVLSVSGTASADTTIEINLSLNVNAGTYYLKVFNWAKGLGIDYWCVNSSYTYDFYNTSSGSSSAATKTYSTSNLLRTMQFKIANGTAISSTLQFKPMLVSGSTAPTSYQPYFSGIRDSAVTSVVSKDSSNNTIDTLSIPSAIQNLTGYGWGIDNTCYNYIDFERKVFVQKVGRVDLGSLTFSSGTGFTNCFYATITDKLPSSLLLLTKYTNINARKYATTLQNDTTLDKCICCDYADTSKIVIIKDTSYDNATTFTTAMNGVYLYFELATPIETDISAYLTTDTIDVEGGGSLEFTNTYNNDVPSDIDYLIEEVKA